MTLAISSKAPIAPAVSVYEGRLRKPSSKSATPLRDAAHFARNLDAMADAMQTRARVAALSYLDIALALEACNRVSSPTRMQRLRRRLWAMRKPCADNADLLKRCFAEGLRAGVEASLHFYGIDPEHVGLPGVSDACKHPAQTCERAVAALSRARPAMARMEFSRASDGPAALRRACTCRATFDTAASTLSIYIDWFNGPDETSGVHHCVPLLTAQRHGGGRFSPARNSLNDLATTSVTRGYAPFHHTPDKRLRPGAVGSS